MRGLTLDDVRTVTYRTDLPDPELEAPTDAIVQVQAAGLCGSDLHPYEGRERVRSGVIPGHEAVGTVLAVGQQVSSFAPGDRVIVPFTTSCGTCEPCRRGVSARCERGQLFGYGSPDDPGAPALQGAQAELLRVPLADGTLVRVPDRLGDLEALLLADNLPTGWEAAERAAITPGDTVAVVGLGAVGLSAVHAALALGAGEVIGIDPVEQRRVAAARLGARTVEPNSTRTRKLWSVIEAAGTPAAQRLAFEMTHPGGTLSIISVQTADRFAFSPVEAYDRNLTVRTGRASVRSTLDRLLPRVAGEVQVPAEAIITVTADYAAGPDLYRRFSNREFVKAAFV